MPATYAFATKTYKGDYEAFTTLCRSIDRHNPELAHYVITDRSDLDLFRSFESERRILIDSSRMLPMFHQFDLLGRRLWWRWPWFLVRGWIYQQLAKIQVAASLAEDAVVIIDSDAILLNPIERHHVFDGNRVKLYHTPGAQSGPARESVKWHNLTCQLLGLPERGYTGSNFIQTPVVWSPAVVRAMIARIESASCRQWFDAPIRHFRFSEYLLYGVFCQHVPGEHQASIKFSQEKLTHPSWHYDFATREGVEAFVEEFAGDSIVALIQSNLGICEAERVAIFRQIELSLTNRD